VPPLRAQAQVISVPSFVDIRKKQMKRMFSVLGLSFTILGGSALVNAGEIHPDLSYALYSASPGQPVSAIVFLDDQVDLDAINAEMDSRRAPLKDRHERVVESLRAVADVAQVDILDRLTELESRGRVSGVQSFWVTNCIRIDAEEDVIREIAARDDVEMVYLNYEIEMIRPTSSEPASGPGSRTPEIGLTAVRAPEVWALGYTGEGMLVSTLDTGVDGSHPALASRWRGVADPRYAGHPDWAFFDPVTSWTFPQDSGTHGTHTMGTVCGGAPGDEVGVAPGAQWIHAAVIDRVSLVQTCTDSILAFQWLIDPDGNPSTNWDVPTVCSNSWGIATSHSIPPYSTPCDDSFWSYLDACEAAGIVILFSAGNEGPGAETLRRPGDRATDDYTTCSVGGIDANTPGWPMYTSSSRGPTHCTVTGDPAIKPEINAPAVSVRSSLPGGGYGDKTGTSMASPHVNGVVALVRQACPDLTVNEVKQILYDTAVDLGPPGKDNDYGYGLVDAYEAVLMALAMCIDSEGRVDFDTDKYGCEDLAQIIVRDLDINTDPELVETQEVTITSGTEPGGESVMLTETGPDTSRFEGTVVLSVTDAPGVLQITDADTVTATYIDADNGLGGYDVEVTTTAVIDCVPPVISNVEVIDIGSGTATISFATDEPAYGTIRYGESCAALTGSASESSARTSHEITLTNLNFSERYYFAVDAVDQQDNLATDDNEGLCYWFSTLVLVYEFPMDTDPGWSTEGQWAFGPPTGGGGAYGDPDPTSGYTGTNVYGYNLNGDYADGIPEYHLSSTPIDCTDYTGVRLTFWRWLGVESSSYDHAYVRVSADGSSYVTVWEHSGSSMSDGAWVYQEFDISAIADGQSTVYLRWTMGTTDGSVAYCGWNIDDVRLIAESDGALQIALPEGTPALVPPGEPVDITVQILEGAEEYVQDSAMLHYRYDGGTYVQVPLVALGGEMYLATLPSPTCGDVPEFYFSAEGTESGIVTEPSDAPAAIFTADVGVFVLIMDDDFETDQGWTVENIDLTDGAWERGIPIGGGDRQDPPTDYDGSGQCYLTDNEDDNSDVDGGPTMLLSPTLDLSNATDPVLTYARWWRNDDLDGDPMDVEVSDDNGASWTLIERVEYGEGDPVDDWVERTIHVKDYITPLTAQMKIRFSARDVPNNSIAEAGIDAVVLTDLSCISVGMGDFDDDGDVDLLDFAAFQGCFGITPVIHHCRPGDMDGGNQIDLDDFVLFQSEFTGPNP